MPSPSQKVREAQEAVRCLEAAGHESSRLTCACRALREAVPVMAWAASQGVQVAFHTVALEPSAVRVGRRRSLKFGWYLGARLTMST